MLKVDYHVTGIIYYQKIIVVYIVHNLEKLEARMNKDFNSI